MSDRPPRPSTASLPAAVLLLGGWAALEGVARAWSGRPFVLPLDDAYIHLAVAHTLAESGTWGVNPGDWAAASSSPLWTLLLAAGIHLGLPAHAVALGLALVAALGVLGVADGWLAARGVAPRPRAIALVAGVAAVPLPFLAGIGMEHVLQLLLALLLAAAPPAAPLRLALLAGALVATRYESASLPAVLAVGALVAGRPRDALALVGAPVLVVLGFGAWWATHGATFLPAGVLLKSAPGAALPSNLAEAPELLLLAAAVAWLGGPGRGVWLATTTIHLVFARVGWFYRYEAWLVGWGLLLLAPRAPWRRPQALLVALVLLALGPRATEALRRYPHAARFMADTDFAVADLLARHHRGEVVGVHNLGVVAASGAVRVVDVTGLGTAEIARPLAAGALDPEALGAVLSRRGVHLVAGARAWRSGGPPPGWVEVGALWAPFPVPPGDFEAVVFWAPAAEAVAAEAEIGAWPWPSGARWVPPAER